MVSKDDPRSAAATAALTADQRLGETSVNSALLHPGSARPVRATLLLFYTQSGQPYSRARLPASLLIHEPRASLALPFHRGRRGVAPVQLGASSTAWSTWPRRRSRSATLAAALRYGPRGLHRDLDAGLSTVGKGGRWRNVSLTISLDSLRGEQLPPKRKVQNGRPGPQRTKDRNSRC
jgi:hypothetical protein